MDALAGLLDGPRAHGAFLLRALMAPPWSMRVQDRAPLCLIALTGGEAWVVPDTGQAVQLRPGDVALVRGPAPYTVADDPATRPQIVIHPGQHCTTLSGEPLTQALDLGVRTWGTALDGPTRMLVGTYEMRGALGERMLDALPALLVVRGDELGSPLPGLLDAEIVRDEPGQEVVLDRMLDLLVITVVRTWFTRHEAPAWYRAHADPVVGRALRMLHNHPERPWTVASLAAEVGVSRAALARRFRDLVGEAPMTYLTGWRLTVAADMLRDPDITLSAVAHRVGYTSPFSLSAAFKRVRGVSPQEHRELATRG